jgi:hypothetical protein
MSARASIVAVAVPYESAADASGRRVARSRSTGVSTDGRMWMCDGDMLAAITRWFKVTLYTLPSGGGFADVTPARTEISGRPTS